MSQSSGSHVLSFASCMSCMSFMALLGLSAAACDPADAGKQDHKAAAGDVVGAVKGDPKDHADTKDEATPAAVGSGAAAPSAPVTADDITRLRRTLGDFESCDKGCFVAGTKETNVETCRLNCKGVAETSGIDPGSPAHKLMDRFDVCLGECADDKAAKETDRETCKLNCAAVFDTLEADVKSGAGPTPNTGSVPAACAEQCTSEVVRCQSACDESRAKETDKATCKLTCSTNSDLCLEKCGEAKRAAP
ncbi:MAG: hypothetical protein R3B09_08660 [Nannocystaceae bacterium]